MIKVGQEIELLIDKFVDKGKCLSRIDGFVIFVEGVLPGEKVVVRIHKLKKKYAEAKLITILESSPYRVKQQCIHFGYCGGCKWQHVAYECQLNVKRQTVSDALLSIGRIKEVEVQHTIPSPDTYYYRTKMEFSFSDRSWLPVQEISHRSENVNFALGLHAPSQFSSVLDIRECHLQKKPSSEIVNKIRQLAIDKNLEPWNCMKKEGYLKHLVIRVGIKTGDLMVNLVTTSYDHRLIKFIKESIMSEFPEITTFVNTILQGNSQNASDAGYEILYGSGFINERIGNYTFQITPNAFFQSNTLQAEVMYNLAMQYAQLKPSDTVFDLYCGTGTISIFLSSLVKNVVGVDMSKDAITSANINARINGVNNCIFVYGDVMKILTKEIVSAYGKPDVVIVDPPRPGLHKRLIEDILQLHPRCLVYISCNPMTQMRDIAMLSNTYHIEAIQPIDMFPQTYHVESIAKLTLRD